MTPTSLLYEAAMKTLTVVTPTGKKVTYKPVKPGPLEGQCYLCGAEGITGHPRKKVIKPTFTDCNLAKAPWSEVVCDACTWALSRRELRNYSLLATAEGLQHPSRQDIRNTLLTPPEPPFIVCIAESGQKWLHYKTLVNHRREVISIRFEDFQINATPGELGRLLDPIERLLTVFTKAEIGSGQYSIPRIREFGIQDFEYAETLIQADRKSPLFRMALHVANIERKPKEAKKECTTVSTRKTKTLL